MGWQQHQAYTYDVSIIGNISMQSISLHTAIDITTFFEVVARNLIQNESTQLIQYIDYVVNQ